MSAASDKRIAAIRVKVRDERALLTALRKQVGSDLKKLMKPASEFLELAWQRRDCIASRCRTPEVDRGLRQKIRS
jgi:hypothetical protein